ncbi:MAG TPA: tRNA epoxyqueuosine(34) reductase QueG [Tepidisphaeraceae bacterium]|nr:tRNA epoxyqueuosine(34) reductase QueG [Tepidisphaeraceae bacterium]
MSELYELAGQIKSRARELGFDLVGVAPADPSRYRDYFRQWLEDGQAGTMEYLARRFDERTEPAKYLPDAKSVICVAINYHVKLAEVAREDRPYQGRVARYALGDDYHEALKDRLYVLADWIRAQQPAAQTRVAVDTAPVMEKELAARAGVGWMGKNTCVINQRMGSWLLLGEILTTLELPCDEPAVDRCGTCRRCLEACPTGAITAPYQLDARRCISYLTIEYRGEMPEGFGPKVGEWMYGCDICQEVCPWNRRAPDSADPAMKPRIPTGSLDLRQVLSWREEEYRTFLRGSAIKRVKLPVLQRNAGIVQANRAGHCEE